MSGGGNKRRSALLSSAPVLAPPVAVASSTPSVGTKRSGMVLSDAAEQDGSGQREVWEEMEGSPVFKKSRLDNAGEYLVSGGNDDGNNESNESNNGGNNESNNNNDGQGAAHSQPASTQGSSARSRTHSPDASSVFDASGAEDATWVTTATEPDAAAAVMPVAPVVRPRAAAALTREQAREVRSLTHLLFLRKIREDGMLMDVCVCRRRRFSGYGSASRATSCARGKSRFRSRTCRRGPCRRWPRRRRLRMRVRVRMWCGRSRIHRKARRGLRARPRPQRTARTWWLPRPLPSRRNKHDKHHTMFML